MRRCLAAILVVGLVSLTSRDAAAQPSEKDYAAYIALSSTPVGAHTPIMMPKANAFAFRYSRYAPPEGLEGNNNLAGSYFMKAGANALVGATLGYVMPGCTDCEGFVNAGLDVHSTLWSSTGGAAVGMSGNFGWANDDGTTAMSAAISVPLAYSVQQASKSTISFFVAPAFGWGRLSEDDVSESGTRPIIGAGAAWTAAGGWGLHAAFNKVMIEDGGNNFGVGFSYKLGN